MSQRFLLYWLRETGCDAGTPLRAEELDPAIQAKVLDLAGDSDDVILRLPYLDKREWRKRGHILKSLRFEQRDRVICGVPPLTAQLRNEAAYLVLTDPAWINAPVSTDANYFPVWQNLSMTLQRSFRDWIPEEYFRDISRFEDREAAYTLILYQAARLCHGRSRGDFTYDLRDYPVCQNTLEQATKLCGLRLQSILTQTEQRLREAGMTDLARRYAPIWHEDVVVSVRKKPKMFIPLLAAESAFINALVELGLNKTPPGVHRFSKLANQAFRKVCGMDLRHLGLRALHLATRVLRDGPVINAA